MDNQYFSPYKIFWVVITALSGIITAADAKKISKFARSSIGGCKQLMVHFGSKEKAEAFINKVPKTSKKYKYLICTDKQFGDSKMTDDVADIKFTKKQIAEAVIK